MTWTSLQNAIIAAAPDLDADLAAGASVAALDRLESVIGRKLPDAFRRAWGEHDGMRGDVFAMLEFLSVGQIGGEWKILREYDGSSGGLEAETTGPVRASWTSPDWIPFVLIGGSTDHLCIDLDPAPGGSIGQVIHASPKDDRRTVLAPSIDAFLELLAASLREGRFEREDGGPFDVCDALGI